MEAGSLGQPSWAEVSATIGNCASFIEPSMTRNRITSPLTAQPARTLPPLLARTSAGSGIVRLAMESLRVGWRRRQGARAGAAGGGRQAVAGSGWVIAAVAAWRSIHIGSQI